eukprot:2905835-Pyramimonas_sp.AAC.1
MNEKSANIVLTMARTGCNLTLTRSAKSLRRQDSRQTGVGSTARRLESRNTKGNPLFRTFAVKG